MEYDLLITGGTVVDGTGADRFVADVALSNGVIAAVDTDLAGQGATAAETIDAAGKIVTPGFVDIHTHYDGQATWDETLDPTSGHGVTTLVMGNCGVGFAPVRPGQEEWLIQLMEGVEDIPGTALSEGMTWGWESFPEYLDVLDERQWMLDVATQVPHGAVRAYVMGERGGRNEPATPEDIAAMAAIVQESIEAGALGVSTSRTIGHTAMDGEPVPGTFAAEDELFAMGKALRDGGGGVFELAPAGAAGLDIVKPRSEVDWMRRLSAEFDQPVSFALIQVPAAPDLWRELMDLSADAVAEGSRLIPQIAGRPFGFMLNWQTAHPFVAKAAYQAVAHLPIEERIVELRKPSVRREILEGPDGVPVPGMLGGICNLVLTMLDNVYPLGADCNYEPVPEASVAAVAASTGAEPLAVAYDALCEADGTAMLMVPLFNYVDGNHDVIREQLLHPSGINGLSDGGAHCGMICDASLPTTMLSHWARDRTRGAKLPLELIVRKQTRDTAQLYGLNDRGVIATGKRADLNVIDFDTLGVSSPRVAYDLPAGGRRLLQDAHGYLATIAGGVVTRRNGVDTGARPGRLIRNKT